MSTIDDIRKAMQDFLAPELRAVSARLDAIDSRLKAQDNRLDAQDKVAEARHNEILARIEGLKSSFELDKRIEKLETRQPRA